MSLDDGFLSYFSDTGTPANQYGEIVVQALSRLSEQLTTLCDTPKIDPSRTYGNGMSLSEASDGIRDALAEMRGLLNGTVPAEMYVRDVLNGTHHAILDAEEVLDDAVKAYAHVGAVERAHKESERLVNLQSGMVGLRETYDLGVRVGLWALPNTKFVERGSKIVKEEHLRPTAQSRGR